MGVGKSKKTKLYLTEWVKFYINILFLKKNKERFKKYVAL